jgi:hypothetical protein
MNGVDEAVQVAPVPPPPPVPVDDGAATVIVQLLGAVTPETEEKLLITVLIEETSPVPDPESALRSVPKVCPAAVRALDRKVPQELNAELICVTENAGAPPAGRFSPFRAPMVSPCTNCADIEPLVAEEMPAVDNPATPPAVMDSKASSRPTC